MAGYPIGQLLKVETRAKHVATEAQLLGDHLHGRSVSLERYEKLMAITHLVWSNVAQQATTKIDGPVLPDATSEILAALERDRALLQLAQPKDLDISVGGHAEALGILYVLYGSTLGGRMIARLLPECPELSSLPTFHFYAACGALPKHLWPNFQHALAASIQLKEETSACVAAANRTFDLYRQFYDETGIDPKSSGSKE